MPDLNDTDAAAARDASAAAARDAGAISGAQSRRAVLRAAAGAGAAGLAATALTRAAALAGSSSRADGTVGARADADSARELDALPAADEAIVVHVRDAATGELDVFRGTSQVRLTDRQLAARIVRASS
jgi:hypothetical protein